MTQQVAGRFGGCSAESISSTRGVPPRSRKAMRPNQLAPREVRVGTLRIYYAVEGDPERKVLIRAIGIRERNRLRIGRKEFEL
jgi:hypothetical protein